jgi:hypothetical protein
MPRLDISIEVARVKITDRPGWGAQVTVYDRLGERIITAQVSKKMAERIAESLELKVETGEDEGG